MAVIPARSAWPAETAELVDPAGSAANGQPTKAKDNYPPFISGFLLRYLNDYEFLKLCLWGLIPWPGWCIIQNSVMKRLNSIREFEGMNEKKYCWSNLWCNCCGFATIGLFFCCFGLARNREKIRIWRGDNRRFLRDLLIYLLCGFCQITQDLAFAYPAKNKTGTEFRNTKLSWKNSATQDDADSCVGCCLTFLFPLPVLCCLQAQAVWKSSPEQNTCDCLVAFFRALCCGCIGFALNRRKIAMNLGHNDYCCSDCLRYTFGCYLCLVTQEFFESNIPNNRRNA